MKGVVHIPENICLRTFLVEMKYWQIPFEKIAECCSPIVKDEEQDAESERLLSDSECPFKGLLLLGCCCCCTSIFDSSKLLAIFVFENLIS